MERNGDVLTEFNYCPERFRLNINHFDLVDSKMCKDDISKSLFCEVPKSLRNNDILSNGFSVPSDKINSELKNQFIDLVASEKTFINSDEHMLLPIWKSSDSYDFSSSKKMSLNQFISKDSFINGKTVLGASKGSFQIDNCFPPSKSAIASESSLDTTSDSPQTFDDSSSSIEEIFCPSTDNPTEVKAKYNARIVAQTVLKTPVISDNPANLGSALENVIPKLCSKESGEVGQKKDRVMPELIPTLICLDDDDEEDSIPNYEEKSPPVVSVAGSPEMPKLIPFSAEADELLRLKAEHLGEKGLLSSLNKNTSNSLANAQSRKSSVNDSKTVRCQNVDLQTCTRKLFPDAEVVNVEHFKAKYTKYLSSPVKKQDKERGFSFSASFKSSKQQLKNLSRGIDLSVKKTKCWKDNSIAKSQSGNKAFDAQQAKDNLKDDNKNFKSYDSDSQKSFTDVAEYPNKVAKNNTCRLSIDEKADIADNSISSIRQPKILLRRISLDQCSSLHSTGNLLSTEKITFEHCLPSNDSDDNSLTSRPECDDNSSNEAPEIEEIEGIRFFQFRSKRDMEEFNRKPMVGEIDMEMIVPTKTTDITQIKGWRNKYFATDSQLHYLQSDDGNSRDESSQNAKSVPMLAGSTETKCLDFRNCLNDNKAKLIGLKVPLDANSVAPKSEVLKSETKEKLKDEKPANAMSAFVSKELDDFLLNSATLNIALLQTVNPNIIPIPPDASILGLGKLSQPNYELNTLAALKRRNFLNKLKEERKPPVPAAIYSDSDDAVIILSSSDESSTDDDVPVAKLHSRRKRMATSRLDNVSPVSSIKRRRSDESVDGTSQRVVLRLTKESRGAADGYKVSDIICENENSEESSSSSSSFVPSSSSSDSKSEELPDEFKKAPDGSSPVIKDTIFLKESEPKLLEEFLNNLNVLGTNNDVAMLVQSNKSYFVKGPVLEPDMCSEALDALLTNKEFIDSKNKHTPKKKLKAWQKYLPKKLTKTQQQKITTVPHVSKVQVDVLKKPSKPEVCEKSSNLKNEKVTTKGNIKDNRYNLMKKLSKNEKTEPEENIINVKAQPPVSKEVPKVRKRRSRSAIELSDSFSFIERGKRSIRLPARYLDSAVLAAGSEWVSPIFVEDEKKTRKQLLDVLDKITPTKEMLSSEENKKSISKKDEPSSSDQLVTKKIPIDNNQLSKGTKRQMKTSGAAKKIKIDDIKDCITIKESNNSKTQSSSIAKNSLEDCPYLLPTCSCSPCSRTMSYKKSTKEFLCFSHNQVPFKESNSKTLLEKESAQESTLKELAPPDVKLISSVDHNLVKESEIQNDTPCVISEDSQSARPNSILESEIQSKITEEPEVIETNDTLMSKVSNAAKLLTSKDINVAQDGSKKVVFLLSAGQKAIQLASEFKSKHPILSRKNVSESPLSEGLKSPTRPNLVSSARILPHPSVASSTPNVSPIVFKLPTATDNRNSRPLLPRLPQTNSVAQGQMPNNSANLPNNLALPLLQSSSSQQGDSNKLAAKGYKIGGVYVYSPGNDKNSSPMIAYVTNKKNSPLPLPVIPDSLNNAAVQPIEADNASLSTPPKVSLDLHNYNKKASERRRKSPLSERVFKESPENVIVGPPEVHVDVDTVDELFNPKFILKKQLTISEGSDASDIECDEIFSTNMQSLIYCGLKKSISERKRRLFIKKSFERLKMTSPLFNNAKNCADILTMATFAVNKLKTKEIALKQAKRVLRLRNAQLLEKLASHMNDIKETESKQLQKKQIITAIANDWVKYRQKRAKLLSTSKAKKVRKEVNTSPKVDQAQADPALRIDIEQQTRVVTQQLDFEVEESPQMEISDSPIQFEVASKDIEQPHVQLRILEMPTSEADIITLMDTEVEVKMEETLTTEVEEVNLPQQNPEKNVSVPAGSLDGNNSDDDLLIIDLEENTAAKASPQKEETAPQDIKPLVSPPPMREFPGLVPIFPPEFYEEDNPFAIDLSKFSTDSKTLSKDSINVDAIRNSLNPPSERTSTMPTGHGNKSPGKFHQQEKFSKAAIAKERLSTRGYQAEVLDNPSSTMPPGLNLSPRNPLHRTCKDVQILHGVGNCPDDEVKDVLTPNVPKLPLKIHEEIVIDDSDDEPMDLEQKQGSSTPSESTFQFRPPVTSVIDEMGDSRCKNLFS